MTRGTRAVGFLPCGGGGTPSPTLLAEKVLGDFSRIARQADNEMVRVAIGTVGIRTVCLNASTPSLRGLGSMKIWGSLKCSSTRCRHVGLGSPERTGRRSISHSLETELIVLLVDWREKRWEVGGEILFPQ